MTREEQIEKEAHRVSYNEDEFSSFIAGAEWADEHPNISEEKQVGMGDLGMMWQKKALIEKACKYLSETLMDNHDNCGYDVVSSFDTITLNEYIEDFKRAMEE